MSLAKWPRSLLLAFDAPTPAKQRGVRDVRDRKSMASSLGVLSVAAQTIPTATTASAGKNVTERSSVPFQKEAGSQVAAMIGEADPAESDSALLR